MKQIVILDYQHLDHSLFMKSFAEQMALRRNASITVLHADSPYTERIIQTGVPRQEATLRCIREVNHRLVALLADSGVPSVGIHPYQKNLFQVYKGSWKVDTTWFEQRPAGTHLVMSTLADTSDPGLPVPVPIGVLAEILRSRLNYDYLVAFSQSIKPQRTMTDKTPPASTRKGALPPEGHEPTYAHTEAQNGMAGLPENTVFCSDSSFTEWPM